MLRRALRALAVLAITASPLMLPAGVAAQGTGAQLLGIVADRSGEALPGVTLTAWNRATGLKRVTVSEAGGRYRFPSLPADVYNVSADLEGFSTVEVEDVDLRVGERRELDFTLRVAPVEEVITVSDNAPLVRTNASGGTSISTEELESLPLNGRQFANLGSLAAGTTLSFNPDPTKPGQAVVQLNGGVGRNVNYMIDGGDNMDDTIGGALQNFSLEGVQEFQILTQTYKAEYGRSTGGVLSVVTRSGTNHFNGSLFGFFRDDRLNAKTETEKRAGVDKQPFSRDQIGGSLGGPIVRDKAHFFVTYEELESDRETVTDTGGIFPDLDGRTTSTPFTDELLTAKLTYDVSAKQFLQLRYAEQENTDTFNAVPNVTPDNFGLLTNKAETLLLGYTVQIGSNAFNEAILQDSEFDNLISSVSSHPTNVFPGGVTSGQNGSTPQGTFQEKRQFRDDFSFSRSIGNGFHDFKIGLEYVDEPKLGGDFPTGLNGTFQRAADTADAPITSIVFNGGSFFFSTPNEQYRVYAQDDWQVSDRLTLNLGLRYEFTDVLELDQRSSSIWRTLSTLPDSFYDETPYLSEFRNGGGGRIDSSDDDFAPRIGFTWDLDGSGERLLRGGWGIYYDFPYTNATVLFPAAAVLSQFGEVFRHDNPSGILNPDGSLFQPGDPLPPNQLDPDQATLAPSPGDIASPTLQTPYSTQLSIGYSQQLNPWIGLNIDISSIRYKHLPFRFRANPIVDTDGDGIADARRFAAAGVSTNFRLWHGDGEVSYDALNIGIKGRLGDKIQFQAFYTLSEAEGNILAGADEFRLNAAGHQPDLGGTARDASVDPFDPWCDACFGPLNTDSTHRITLSGVWFAPKGINVSGILRYRSALPYTVHQGVDANGDGFNLDLLPGDSVNSERGAEFLQLDLRVAYQISLGGDSSLELIAEVFNVLDDENPAGFVGSLASSNFGRPTTFAGDQLQGEQRLAQLGLRLRF